MILSIITVIIIYTAKELTITNKETARIYIDFLFDTKHLKKIRPDVPLIIELIITIIIVDKEYKVIPR